MLKSSSYEASSFQPSLSLPFALFFLFSSPLLALLLIAQPLLTPLLQPPPWQGEHILATRLMQPLTLESRPQLLEMKCSAHSKRPNSLDPKRKSLGPQNGSIVTNTKIVENIFLI